VVAGVATAHPEVLDSIPDLDDSKKLTPTKREALFLYLQDLQQQQKIHIITHVHEANRQAMREIILSLGKLALREVWIDGADNFSFDIPEFSYAFARKKNMRQAPRDVFPRKNARTQVRYVIGGDAKIPLISAASIVAKVLRDAMMRELALQYPAYGFDAHKGYGTRQHQDAIVYYGITVEHRKSYAPIKRLISEGS